MNPDNWPFVLFKEYNSVEIIAQKLSEFFISEKESITEDEKCNSMLELVASAIKSDGNINILITVFKNFIHDNNLKEETNNSTRLEVISLLENAIWFWGTQIEYNAASPSEQWKKIALLTSNLLTADILEANSAKVVLPLDLLIYALNLPEKEDDFFKKFVKIRTRLYLRQEKFNILREETEGYSKVITVLSTLPAPPADPSNQINLVFATIGQFDLDPNRVIDLILNEFEQQLWNLSFILLLKNFQPKNIIHILGFKYTSYHNMQESVPLAIGTNASKDNQTKIEPERPQGRSSTSSLTDKDKEKNKDKQRSEPSPDTTTNTSKFTPESLYNLTALLIAFEIITLDQIFPYLESKTIKLIEKYKQEEADLFDEINTFGVINLSSKTGSDRERERDLVKHESKEKPKDKPGPVTTLADNAATTTTKNNKIIQRILYSTNSGGLTAFAEGEQIIGLLAAMLKFRLWDISAPLIDRLANSGANPMRWPEVSLALAELTSWYIDPVYSKISSRNLNLAKPNTATSFVPHNLPSQIKQCHDLSELMSKDSTCLKFIRKLTHYLSKSTSLFSRLCRLLQKLLKEKIPNLSELTFSMTKTTASFTTEQNSTDNTNQQITAEQDEFLKLVHGLISEIFLPALTRIDSNPAISSELWGLISLFPFQMRFELYDAWKGPGLAKEALGGKDYILTKAELLCQHGSKMHMKRLAKENIKTIGRQIAKYAHSGPLLVYTHILSQIEVFDNLIPLVVDALRFSTELSRDCMAYCIVIQLRKDNGKLKDGDTHYSTWFSALCKFIGTFYKKYPLTDLKGILHFLLQRLAIGESIDLLVLKELLSKMGGCETVLEISHSQLECLAGGNVLRGEAMGGAGAEVASRRASTALQDELVKSKTALPILLFIAQVRTKTLYGEASNQLKLISYLYDTCQDVLMQFTDFLLNGTKAISSFAAIMPSLHQLVNEVGLSLPIAFQLVRPLFRAAIQTSHDPDAVPDNLKPWHPFNPLIKVLIQSKFPETYWEVVSPELYITFWSLSLYDIIQPKSRYDSEIAKIKSKYNEVSSQLDTLNKARVRDEKAIKLKKSEMSKLMNRISNLTSELDEQKNHVESMRGLIESRKAIFFVNIKPETYPLVTEIIMQICVLPRVLLSPTDATFCTQFFFHLHSIDTPGLSTLSFLDKVLKTVTPLIFCTTEYEAGFIGFLLHNLLSTANSWMNSEKVYEKEGKSHTGLILNFELPPTSESYTNYSQFQHIYLTWHSTIKKIILACLNSSEYMHIRSGLVLLSKVSGQYPTRIKAGKAILSRVQKIEQEESGRVDLQLMAKTLGALMKRSQSSWLNEDGTKPIPQPQPVPQPASHSSSSNLKQTTKSESVVPRPPPGPPPANTPISSDHVDRNKERSSIKGNTSKDNLSLSSTSNKEAGHSKISSHDSSSSKEKEKEKEKEKDRPVSISARSQESSKDKDRDRDRDNNSKESIDRPDHRSATEPNTNHRSNNSVRTSSSSNQLNQNTDGNNLKRGREVENSKSGSDNNTNKSQATEKDPKRTRENTYQNSSNSVDTSSKDQQRHTQSSHLSQNPYPSSASAGQVDGDRKSNSSVQGGGGHDDRNRRSSRDESSRSGDQHNRDTNRTSSSSQANQDNKSNPQRSSATNSTSHRSSNSYEDSSHSNSQYNNSHSRNYSSGNSSGNTSKRSRGN